MGKRIIDVETGEIIENVTRVVTESQQEKISNYRILQQRRSKLRKIMKEHCGNFYFYRYDKLIEQLNDDTATAFRFLYLCACANQEGYFIKYNKEYCTTIEDFTYIFDKGRDSVRRYMEKLINNKLIYKDSEGYRLNPMYYSMGGMDNEFKRQSVRTFNNAVKEMYYNSNPKEHGLMGQFMKLVPYINIYSNTLCLDIECTDKNLIQPLSKSDIASILQSNNTYGYNLLEKMMSVLIKGEPVIGCFKSMNEYQYRINPRLFYRGNNSRDLQDLIDLFDISKNQYMKKQKRKKMSKGEN